MTLAINALTRQGELPLPEWNLGLLAIAGLAGFISIGWLSAEIWRLRALRIALTVPGDPMALVAFRAVMLRRLHWLAPPFLLLILGIDVLYHAGLQVSADAAPEAVLFAAGKRSEVDRQLLISVGLVAFVYGLALVLRWRIQRSRSVGRTATIPE